MQLFFFFHLTKMWTQDALLCHYQTEQQSEFCQDYNCHVLTGGLAG